jgi:hypothetical protein
MRDTIILIGSEDVQRAGYEIKAAADTMQRAANQIEWALSRFMERLEELPARTLDTMEDNNNE